eukprot:TRINITY_DN1655_c0_g1_i5.p1 TRINITY_DN1655_c0_g1~~TRINITY_DN1655_c0_g1_i5.p1  ORF type:complete len:120 (+),score=11.53 TRINITY_DN1655_c0_g1_i5:989-1348(+)
MAFRERRNFMKVWSIYRYTAVKVCTFINTLGNESFWDGLLPLSSGKDFFQLWSVVVWHDPCIYISIGLRGQKKGNRFVCSFDKEGVGRPWLSYLDYSFTFSHPSVTSKQLKNRYESIEL